MRRSTLALIAVAALAALAVPAFAASTVSVPKKFSSKLGRVRAKSQVPVRLPSKISVDVSAARVFGTVESLKNGQYDLALGVGRSCHTATACFIAEFFAKRGAAPKLRRKVALAHGIQGRYQPIRCGASCAAAEIQWRQPDKLGRNVLYDIQYKGTKRQMVALANSAIKGGAR